MIAHEASVEPFFGEPDDAMDDAFFEAELLPIDQLMAGGEAVPTRPAA